MDRNTAIRLLDETFNNDFSNTNFLKFVKELFNDFEIIERDCTRYISKEYSEFIHTFLKLGEYKDDKHKQIEVLIVKLNKTSSRDRARTMQRNFIASWLNKTESDAALVAFYGDDPNDWRFSFVKMEYNRVRGDDGKARTVKELTPVKRYSFLVGVNEPNHTCASQFADLIIKEDKNPTLEEIEHAFSIEKVTKEFFNEYKELFLELEESLQKVIKKDEHVKEEFESKGISTVDFSKKLLGQIVFIYFLQKKGWLGVEKDSKWGNGPKDFMRRLFGGGSKNLKPLVHYKNFFNEILEPLFYEALANDRSADDHFYRLFNCKIPFLNGGLFEPINEYKWAETDIVIDNIIFDRILSTFDRFNFTVKEDEPLEKEVAVDPEMLGKVFENLLEVKDRKSKGAFYTPREIVHYMCQQSLINYLETNTSIPREDLKKFIQEGDIILAGSIRILQEVDKLQEELNRGIISANIFENKVLEQLGKLDFPKSIIDNRKLIDCLLKEIKIVDPAVGSGAFPVGMMNEIVKARSILSVYNLNEKKSDYDLKRETIENCLYGVDIEPSAVEITKLRFWLSLIVDEQDMQNIKPLPNLDHKIMCGNSLLEEFEGVKLFDEKLLGEVKRNYLHEMSDIKKKISDLIQKKSEEKEIRKLEKEYKELEKDSKKDKESKQSTLEIGNRIKESQRKLCELKRLHKEFFNAENRNFKKQLRNKIDGIEWELIEETLKEQNNLQAIQKLEQYKKNKTKPFFLWKLYFSDVFQRENPGFDVVIANPPYVRQEEIKELKPLLSTKYSVYNSTSDLYTYFYELGIYLLRQDGVLTFISSNKFMRAKYGINLRRFFKNKTEVKQIIDFGERHMFEAITNTCIFITKNKACSNNYILFGDYINPDKESLFKQDELDDSAWTIVNKKEMQIKLKVDRDSKKLENWDVKIFRGLLTGFNEAFIIDGKLKKEWCSKNPKIKEYLKPVLRGRDIKRWTHVWGDLWIIVFPSGWTNLNRGKQEAEIFFKSNFPEVYFYFEKVQEEYEKSDTKTKAKGLYNRGDMGEYWWELRSCDYYDRFSQEKIVWIELTDKNKFSFSNKEEYLLAGAFFMIGNSLKYLLSFLNSKLCKYYFNLICNSSGMGTTQWKKFAMDKIPIKDLSKEQQKPFIQLVDQILLITKNEHYLDSCENQGKVKKIEKEIDELIYNLYELTPDEIKIIEESGNKK